MSDKPKDQAADAAAGSGADAPDIAKLQERLAFLESENKKAFEARDKLKSELRSYQSKEKDFAAAEAKRLAEAGKFQEALEHSQKQIEEWAPLVERYKAREELDAKELEVRLAELSDDEKALVPQSLSVSEQLAQVHRLVARRSSAPQGPKVPPASPAPSQRLPNFASMTPKARAQWFAENKEVVKKVLATSGKRVFGG